MKCRQCGNEDTKVLESRGNIDGRSIRRRRQCNQCEHRFTTYEREESLIFSVKKKDDRTVPYDRAKFMRSIQTACQKRQTSLEDIENIVSHIENDLREQGENIVSTETLGELALQSLISIDKVAYVRFASVYRDFQDYDEFMAEIKRVRSDNSVHRTH